MENQSNLILSKTDFQKLSSLIEKAESSETARLLEEELGRTEIVEDDELPKDVVSMNSKVCFQDLETGKETIAFLVFPHEANIEENRLSILAPVGAALIGLKVGQTIRWPVPNGKEKTFKVVSVLSQFESA